MTALGDFSSGDVLTAADLNAIGTWSTFTPTWTSSGTQPTLGNGSLLGRYSQVNDLIFVEVDFRAGTTTTFGTATYFFATPVTIAAPLFGFAALNGGGFVFDSNLSVAYTISVGYSAAQVDYVSLRSSVGSGDVGATAPFTFANGDIITFGYVAKVA